MVSREHAADGNAPIGFKGHGYFESVARDIAPSDR